jgi:hypothetical protein
MNNLRICRYLPPLLPLFKQKDDFSNFTTHFEIEITGNQGPTKAQLPSTLIKLKLNNNTFFRI